jgi:integrase
MSDGEQLHGEHGAVCLQVNRFSRVGRSAGAIRKIFNDAFAAAGLPYFNPHSFRKTLALLGGQLCNSPEEYKAWSQNLGHENVLTTFSSYGDEETTRLKSFVDLATHRLAVAQAHRDRSTL